MDRSALLAALVAATAAIAFVLGAAAFGPTLAGQGDESGPAQPPEDPPDPEEAADGGGTDPGGDGGLDASCSSCSALDLRSHVAAVLPGVNPRLLLGALALLVVGLAAAGLRPTDDGPSVESEQLGDGTIPDRDRTQREAPAPDGDVAPSNDVYRAWLALGTAVEEPATATSPRERARRAIDAGLPAEPVESVTRTFEAVRYGPADPTPERERVARAAIERIEGVELPDDRPGSATDDSADTDPAAGTIGRPAGGDR